MEITTPVDLYAIFHRALQFLYEIRDQLGLIAIRGARVGSGNDVGGVSLTRHTQHLQGDLEVFGPVIKARQNMGVNVNHSGYIARLNSGSGAAWRCRLVQKGPKRTADSRRAVILQRPLIQTADRIWMMLR